MAQQDRLRSPLLQAQPVASGATQDTIVIADFGGVTLDQRTRTSKTGKTGVRYNLSIETDPVLNILSGVQLGKGPAEAVRDLIIRQIYAITETAKPSTIARRKRSAAALAKGDPKAVERYNRAGSRVKAPHPPGWTDRVYYDSGLLAEGVHVMQNPREGSWTVNVSASRLEPSTFGKGFEAMVARLVNLVPALGGGEALVNSVEVQKAIAASSPVTLLREYGSRVRALYGNALLGGARRIIAAFG